MPPIPLPSEIEALIAGPITAETIEALRARYRPEVLDGRAADELFEIQARVGDRGGPEFRALVKEALAGFLIRDFDPFPRR
ncbi:MAG: hypothetical protein EA385_12820 [Salinarimonadaceae bacterium]|nr:MAG: hypothetical protein EA385_12820 [Salinarimonadaceae bacterium]